MTEAILQGSPTPESIGAALDEQFFATHRDRKFRIRVPEPREFEAQFRTLGAHAVSRRRIIVARAFGMLARWHNVKYMPIPFLLFADETVEDRDDVLRPIFDGIMQNAAATSGMV